MTDKPDGFIPTLTGDGDDDIRVARAAATGADPKAPITAADRAKFAPATTEAPPKFEGEAPRKDEVTGGDRAAFAPDGALRAATAGDPNAPQGTGREQNTSDPANRPAPAGNIRFADADPRSKQ